MVNKERGGIVSFIVIAVVLAGLFAGAIYFSKQQGREARNNVPTPQVANKGGNENKSTQQQNQGSSKPSNQQSENKPQGSSQPQNNTQQQQNQNQPGRGAAPSTPAPQGTDHVATTGPSSELPSTGPSETAAVVLGLGVLTFTTYVALHSRRNLRASALRK